MIWIFRMDNILFGEFQIKQNFSTGNQPRQFCKEIRPLIEII